MKPSQPLDQLPGAFQQLVLMAVIRLKGRAFGSHIARQIQFRTGRTTTVAAVGATLVRLEARGWVRSWLETRERLGGTVVRRYDAKLEGWRALQLALHASDCMRAGEPGLERTPDRIKQRLAENLDERWVRADPPPPLPLPLPPPHRPAPPPVAPR